MLYAKLDSISRRLSGRITVVDTPEYGVGGITKTSIGPDLIEIIGASCEEFMNLYLSMVYEMPLKVEHPFIQGIAEKLIIAEIYTTYFPAQMESADNLDSYSSLIRKQALNDFQCLFNGLGIFVSGAESAAMQVQNDESQQQLQNRPIILQNEIVKKYIGYDYNGDNVSDTDLFKSNLNVDPSFYVEGDFELLQDWEEGIIDGVRVRSKNYDKNKAEIDFYDNF